MKEISLIIDGRETSVPAGTTVLAAAAGLGIDIPTLCHVPQLEQNSCCMVCGVYETGSGRMIPACSAAAAEGMKIDTSSEPVRRARRAALELLAAEHLGDCLGPCTRGCPAHMDIPRMLRRIGKKDFSGALATVLETIPFPSITGRVCPAPCEKVCKRKKQDTAVSIRTLKRFLGDTVPLPDPVAGPDTGKTVAVIGGGMTGLTACLGLRRQGYAVLLYEKADETGGALISGVDRRRLPPEIIRRECDRVARAGVTIRTGLPVRTAATLDKIRETADAVVIATGRGTDDELALLLGRLVLDELKRNKWSLPAKGVFAGGAAIKPCAMTAQGIAEGQRLARAVGAFLRDGSDGVPVKTFQSRTLAGDGAELARRNALTNGRQRLDAVSVGAAPVTPSPDAAAAEAGRCFECDCHAKDSCRLREACTVHGVVQQRMEAVIPSWDRIRVGDGVWFEPGKCIKCGACVTLSEQYGEPAGFAFYGRGIGLRVGPADETNTETALTVAAEECVKKCPSGALAKLRISD